MPSHVWRHMGWLGKEFGLNDLEAAYTLSAPWAAGVGTVRGLANL